MSDYDFGPVVCDLDGTLCDQWHHKGYNNPPPKKDVIDKLNEHYRMGHRITIYTARGMNTFKGDIQAIEQAYRTMTEKWLAENGVLYHELRFGKPPAMIYVDDRGMKPDEFATRQTSA